MNEVIQTVLHWQQRELARQGIEIRRKPMANLPLVSGHQMQLEEVIANLVSNAADALQTVDIRSRLLTLETGLQGRDSVFVEVKDTGPGIDPSRVEEIFDAFVTTKAHGTGLGLAICRMIVENHGGHLTASSDGRSGTRFRIVLPRMVAVAGVRDPSTADEGTPNAQLIRSGGIA
jgi:signal transduction histidine kinase